MTDDDWLAELEALQAEGRELQSASEELQREIAGRLTIAEHGAVTVVLDAQGIIADISIDEELREEVEPDELVHELNSAIMRAVGAHASKGQPRWSTEADGLADAALIAPMIATLLSSLSAGVTSTPREFSSDLKNVRVTALLGSIVRVECDLAWVRAASGTAIADEVVRVARRASIETDMFDRFAKSGVHDD
jgi:DNA-binding protein YbaB